MHRWDDEACEEEGTICHDPSPHMPALSIPLSSLIWTFGRLKSTSSQIEAGCCQTAAKVCTWSHQKGLLELEPAALKQHFHLLRNRSSLAPKCSSPTAEPKMVQLGHGSRSIGSVLLHTLRACWEIACNILLHKWSKLWSLFLCDCTLCHWPRTLTVSKCMH